MLTLIRMTDPFLGMFRRLIPSIFGLELGSIISFISIQYVIEFLEVMALPNKGPY
jgi:uncharacterized protein YggT (Ycf19 family)